MSESKFVRIINKPQVLALAFGAMIGWSWVALTGIWIESAGAIGAICAFLLGGSGLIFVALTYAELASAMPQVGGEHVYSGRALGRTASFICTWAILMGYISVVAFEAVAFPTVLEYILPDFSMGYLWTVASWDVNATWVLAGALAAVVIIVINILGIRTAAKFQTLVLLVVIISGASLMFGSVFHGELANATPLVSNGLSGILTVLVMVPFMFIGFDVIPQSAEEIDLPFKEIGRLLLHSMLLALAWYTCIIIAVSISLTGEEIKTAFLPTASAAEKVIGASWGGTLLVVGGIAGILTSWNAILVGGSRALYALAEAGQVPKVFASIHPKYKTPHNAILMTGGLAIIAPLFGRPAMVWLVNAGGLGVVIAYAFVALSFLKLRQNEPYMDRPYRVKFGKTIGSIALIFSLGLMLLYLPWSPSALKWPEEWLIFITWWGLGFIFYMTSSSRS